MPSGIAARVRELVAAEDTSHLELERVPPTKLTKTGFVNVIKIGEQFQARLQVPGDGRGGEKKRKQEPLPGLLSLIHI